MSDSIRERVIQVLRVVLGSDANPEDTRLELESLKMLELIVALENEFGVQISEDAPLGQITSSVDNIVEFLQGLKR